MASSAVAIINDSNFESEVTSSPVPVVVDFFTTWCGPCQRMAPLIDQLAQENAGKVKIGKMDIEESPEVASRLGVQVIPTFVVFKGGQEVDRATGAMAKGQFQAFISKHF